MVSIQRAVLAVLILCLDCDAARAEIITRCGASKGYSYFFKGALVPKDKSGWQEDSISGGDILLVKNGKDYDIIYTDALGGTKSARADGFTIVEVR